MEFEWRRIRVEAKATKAEKVLEDKNSFALENKLSRIANVFSFVSRNITFHHIMAVTTRITISRARVIFSFSIESASHRSRYAFILI